MFYAPLVLAKKGPLARVWLAAHWDKKLTKAMVFETDIRRAVQAIIQPENFKDEDGEGEGSDRKVEVKLALRTSGHLLLGVARIYSRKAKYLLADCNEAFMKIKMAFRPGQVDLPEENLEAAMNTITLPETIDFELQLPDFGAIPIQMGLHQSRPEEITIQDHYEPAIGVNDDDYDIRNIDDFGEREAEEAGETPDFDSHLRKQSIQHTDASMMGHSDANQMDVDFINLPNDEFGAGYTEPDDTMLPFEGQSMMAPAGVSADDHQFEPAAPQPSLFEELIPADHDTEMTGLRDGRNQTETGADRPGLAGLQSKDQTTLVANQEEAFVLDPIDVTAMAHYQDQRRKRKRKLIIDDPKSIPSDVMKSQLADTSDILAPLDLAPPTAKLMYWKETGMIDRLMTSSTRPILSATLSKGVSAQMVHVNLPDDQELLDSVMSTRSLLSNMSRNSTSALTTSQAHSTMTPIAEELENEPPDMDIFTDNLAPIEELDDTASKRSRLDKTGDLSTEEAIRRSTAGEVNASIKSARASSPGRRVNKSKGPASPSFRADAEDLPELTDDFSYETSVKTPTSVPVETQQEDGLWVAASPTAAGKDIEDQQWSRRTRDFFCLLERQLRHATSIRLNDLLAKKGHGARRTAAASFYSMLVLSKQQVISVQQDQPFGPITITRGPSYASKATLAALH